MNRSERRRKLSKLSKAQREALRQLNPAVMRACESDRTFFERFPQRQHRVRRAFHAEIEQHRVITGAPDTLLPGGVEWYCLVRRLGQSNWARIISTGPAGIEPDSREKLAAALFTSEVMSGAIGWTELSIFEGEP